MVKASQLQFNQKALRESMEEVRQQVLIHTVMIHKCLYDCCVISDHLRNCQ